MVQTVTFEEVEYLTRNGFIRPGQSYDIVRDITLAHRNTAGIPTGILCLRPMFYAHSLVVPSRSRFIANQLVDFAHDLAKMASVHGTLFQVEEGNDSMRKYVEQRGAVAEPGSILYRLDRLAVASTSRKKR